MAQHNNIKVSPVTSSGGIYINPANSIQTMQITNNQARYYSELAKKYKDEAQLMRDMTKYYAEQNSNVTFEYIEIIKNELNDKISLKQDSGDYALKIELPEKVSELENDVPYVNQNDFENEISILRLPDQTDKSNKFLMTNGTSPIWQSVYNPSILSPIWSDHLLNRMDVLRADTFTWHSGDVYSQAYNELVAEYDAVSSTASDSGITYKNTSKGYKIADASQETAVLNKYNSSGNSWFYLLDKTNKKFKLPRIKSLNSSESYLYFYVDGFSRTAIEQTAGLNTSLFATKADVSYVNTRSQRYVVSKSSKSQMPSWYVLYSDDWCEQGGYFYNGSSSGESTINLLKAYNNSNYFVSKNFVNAYYPYQVTGQYLSIVRQNNSFKTKTSVEADGLDAFVWHACGYIT